MQITLSAIDLRLSNISSFMLERLGINYENYIKGWLL